MTSLIVSFFIVLQLEGPPLKGDFCFSEKFSQTCLDFYGENNFRYEEISDKGVINGKGSFAIRKDTLFLTFEKMNATAANSATYIGQESFIQDTTWTFKIVKKDESAIILKNNMKRYKYKAVTY